MKLRLLVLAVRLCPWTTLGYGLRHRFGRVLVRAMDRELWRGIDGR